ncbi:MAG: DUF3459 domain-containing protein [Anaerolineae bacterium]|nr:DUF3459 domain-containing protein [Anaerolineae bacterium]
MVDPLNDAPQVDDEFVFGPAELTDVVVAQRKAALSGIAHGHALSPRDPQPGEPVTLHMTAGPGVNAREAWCYYTTDGDNPRGSRGVAAVGAAVPFRVRYVAWDDLVWGFVTHFEAVIPGQPDGTLVRYLIECDGQYADGGEGSATRTPYFAFAVDAWRTPDWIHDAVMYYVMPDRFYPGDGRAWRQTGDVSKPMGGALRGIRDKLDYIQSMGFNCLWLMPWMAGPTYHKYGATDFYAVDPDFGAEQDLRDLIDDAHRRGMRVLVDFVGNHCSDQHPYFLEAKANPASAHRDWFYFGDSGEYVSFFGSGELPHLCHDNPETRRYIFDLARHWVREYGIDGYDLDYAVGPALGFWAEFGRAVREVSDDVVIFTEGVTTPEALLTFQGRVDGCQDFAWCQAARRTFGSGKLNVEQFERFLAGSDAYFPAGFVAPIMVDNQNMNRLLFVAGNDQRRLRVAAACLYSISRPLSVWAGTEMGMSQTVDSAHTDLNYIREATAWDAMNADTVAWFRRLGALRAEHIALRRGTRTPLVADAATGVLAYEKSAGADRCVVILNTSEAERTVTLAQLRGGQDALAGRPITDGETGGTIRVPAWSAAYVCVGA